MRDRRALGKALQIERLRNEDATLVGLLEESETLEEARGRVLSYLEDVGSAIRIGSFDLDRIERSSAFTWIGAFQEMLSPENEAIAGFSTIDLLWHLARGETDTVSDAFVEEFVHVFRAIAGRSGLGRGWFGGEDGEEEFGRFPGAGRRAARARSRFLDKLAHAVQARADAYGCGLDKEFVRARRENRDRILRYFGASARDWERSEWQTAHVLKGEDGARALQDLVPLTSEEIASVHLAVRYGIPWGITPYYLSLFDFDSADRTLDMQVRAQVIPPVHTARSMIEHRSDRSRALDFMRERDTSPVDHVTRRYPSVAILKVCDTCPQICTYCQRNWEINDAMVFERIPSRDDLEPAIAWFEEHAGVTDVLLTGGDPMVLDDRLLDYLLDRFSRMEHVKHVRVGTRIPVTMPMRVTDRLAELLAKPIEPGRRSISVVTHVESGAEITPELAASVDRLKRRGIAVYNQQVLTLQASLRFQAVATRIALKRVGVDPYYSFYTKGKDEHRDYLVPIARVLQERKEEARLLPGIFRTDEPVFNVPGLGKSHLRAQQDRELIAIRADGRRVYLFHPWEKAIVPVAPWPYVDVSIGDYLERIAGLGEDIEDYESIWFYL